MTIIPSPFKLEVTPNIVPLIEFGELRPTEPLLQTSVMINGIPTGGSADLADLSKALRDYAAKTFPKEEDKEPVFRISGKFVRSMAPYTPTSAWFRNYAIIHCIEWQLIDKRTSKVLVEKQMHGGQYIGDLKLIGGKDRIRKLREEESYANRMAAVSSLQCFLSDPAVITALDAPTAPVNGIEGEKIKVTGNIAAATIQQAAGSVVTVRSGDGFGSAFFISEEGHLLTNDHVIRSGDSVVVLVMSNGFSMKARVLRRSPKADVALLKMEGAQVVPLRHDPVTKKIGDEVFAIGTPEHQDLSQTLTKGIISGFRTVEGRSFIQTDVAINRGNSGGPLVDKDGKVIGLVTAKMIGVGTESIGFAIPIQEVFDSLLIE